MGGAVGTTAVGVETGVVADWSLGVIAGLETVGVGAEAGSESVEIGSGI